MPQTGILAKYSRCQHRQLLFQWPRRAYAAMIVHN
jgi:hypothetical protein